MKRSLQSLALLAAVAFMASGCLNGPAEPDPRGSGTMAFQYQGGPSGAYEASGPVRSSPSGGLMHGTWAAAFLDGEAGILHLIGYRETDESSGDVVMLQLGVPDSVRTYTLKPERCSDDRHASKCRSVLLGFGVEVSDVPDLRFSRDLPAGIHGLHEGTIELTHLEDDRIRGRFQGVERRPDETIMEITDGTFDLPVFDW